MGKMIGFIFFVGLVGSAISAFLMFDKETRAFIWNKNTKLTLMVMSATLIIMFSLAAMGSMVTPKLF